MNTTKRSKQFALNVSFIVSKYYADKSAAAFVNNSF